MTNEWWFSSRKMTIMVVEQSGIIIEAAPIARKFVGQPINNLRTWMSKQGGFRMKLLESGNAKKIKTRS